MKMGSADFKLPWVAVSQPERERLEAELTQEICLLHQLAATDRRVIARRVDSDDILIEISHLCEEGSGVATKLSTIRLRINIGGILIVNNLAATPCAAEYFEKRRCFDWRVLPRGRTGQSSAQQV